MGGFFSKGKTQNTSNEASLHKKNYTFTNYEKEVVDNANEKSKGQNDIDFDSNEGEKVQHENSKKSSLKIFPSEAVSRHKNDAYEIKTSEYRVNETKINNISTEYREEITDNKENVSEIHKLVQEKITRDSFKENIVRVHGEQLNSKISFDRKFQNKNNKLYSTDFLSKNKKNTSQDQSSFHTITENKNEERKVSNLKPKWVGGYVPKPKQNPEAELNTTSNETDQKLSFLNPLHNSSLENNEILSTTLEESVNVVKEENLEPDISSEKQQNVKSEKKSLLRAPPPSKEIGSVLVQRITGVGDSQDLISYNLSGRPSSSYYVASATSVPDESGDVLPPYNHLPFSFLDHDYDLGLGPDAGPQEVSAVQLEEKPLFDSSTVLPDANWLDIDFSRSTYRNETLVKEPGEAKGKFNFEKYKTELRDEDKDIYVKILENIDSMPNLGEDPETLNAFWTKETILRILEESGRYDTVYYDEFGNEYSLRGSRPSYALADWAKDYLSTERPPGAPEPRKRDMNDYTQFFDKVDKTCGKKSRQKQNNKQDQQQITAQKVKRSSKQSTNQKKNKTQRSEKAESNIEKVNKSNGGKLNIVPKERQEEIYNTLMTGGDVGGVLDSLMTPENKVKILEEIIKPSPNYTTFSEDANPRSVTPEFTTSKDIKSPPITSDLSTFNEDTKAPIVATFAKDTKPEETLDPDLENIYEILEGDSVKEKSKIYKMMRDPVGRETVYEALCRIGTERHPEYYESYDEDDNIYPGATSIFEKRKKLLAQRKKKRPKRKIVIQTYPFPDDLPNIESLDKSKYAGTVYDSDALEYNAEKQQEIFEILKMREDVDKPILGPLVDPHAMTRPLPDKVDKLGGETGSLDDVISSFANHSMIKDMLNTPGGKEKVFEALCRIGNTKDQQTFNP